MPSCLERKHTLSGETKQYRCHLVSLENGVGILRYVVDREYDIAGFRLSPGDTTIAVYWEGRPYTLYIWHRTKQGDRAYYFNIADSVSLAPEEFVWRDLAVDILVGHDGEVKVLDEHELPHDLPRQLRERIMRARDHILARFRDILEEAEQLIQTRT